MTTMARRETLWTVARIAEHLRVARHRVEYIIESRAIEPLGTAGIARVFRSQDVRQIAAELGAAELGDTLESGETIHSVDDPGVREDAYAYLTSRERLVWRLAEIEKWCQRLEDQLSELRAMHVEGARKANE